MSEYATKSWFHQWIEKLKYGSNTSCDRQNTKVSILFSYVIDSVSYDPMKSKMSEVEMHQMQSTISGHRALF